jgi:hypothetical protein
MSGVQDGSALGVDSPYVNLRKQLKYLAIGGLGTWYWQVPLHITDALNGSRSTTAVATLAIVLYAATAVLFAHIILLPARGHQVDYLRWQRDSALKRAIPALTVSIVFGYLALFFALSPLCAPRPPSAALSHRLLEAAHAAGGNLQKATSGAQLLLSDAARSLGFGGSGSKSATVSSSATSLDVDLSSLMRTLRIPNGEALASRLGVSKEHTNVLMQTLDQYQRRAQAWKENNISVLGWTGATCGSGSAFMLMLGVAGLLGLFTPKSSVKPKRATL